MRLMAGDRDDIILSDWERERLAALEGQLATSDPRLRRRLTRAHRPDVTIVVAAALVILGAIAVVTTFTRWLWLAVGGLVLMTAGILVGAEPVASRFKRGSGG